MKWTELVVNQMLLLMKKRQTNTFFMIVQCESPKGRRNVCYDREGTRDKENI